MSGDAASRSLVVDPPQRGALARAAKATALLLATVLVTPRLLAYALNRRLVGAESAFSAASESISRSPGRRGLYLRQAFYRRTLASCGRDIHFGFLTVFTKPQTRVGDRVYFGRGCGVGWADIGSAALFADGVQVPSGARQHAPRAPAQLLRQDAPQEFRRVTIGEGAWLGAGSVIMADVGAGTVVGAGAVVTSPLPPGRTAVGVPARVIDTP